MEPDNIWSFATSVYKTEGVAPACIALQNQGHVDIPLLFAVVFACSQNKKISKESVKELHSLVSPWQNSIVKPLRQIRTHLRTGPNPAPNTQTNELRENVKTIELASEKIQIEMMQSWVNNLKIANKKISSPKLSIIIDSINIVAAINYNDWITTTQNTHIHCIAEAAFQLINKSKKSV